MSNRVKDEETEAYKTLLASRFEALRTDLDKSQQEMADIIGTTQNLIFRVENDLKVSTSSLILLFLFYFKNHKVNPEWLFSPRNTDVPKYVNDLKIAKRKRESSEHRRSEIVMKMLKELQDNNLMPQAGKAEESLT